MLNKPLWVTLCICLFLSQHSFAQSPPETQKKPRLTLEQLDRKSVPIAVLLSLDMLPADGLFYAGKTKQGYINLGLAVGGVVSIVAGASTLFADAVNDIGDSLNGNSDNDSEDISGTGLTLIMLGALSFTAAEIWDIIGGLDFAFDLNDHKLMREKEMENKTKNALSNLKFDLALSPNQPSVGLSFKF